MSSAMSACNGVLTHDRLHFAVVSPSSGLAGLVPWVLERGLGRLEHDLFSKDEVPEGIEIDVLQSSKQSYTVPEVRAQEIVDVFASGKYDACFCTLGGEDGKLLLPHLESGRQEIIEGYAKKKCMFFGFSDQTTMHLFLASCGIHTCYGGAVLCQFGMSGDCGILDYTRESIRTAFKGALLSNTHDPNKKLTELRAADFVVPDYHDWFNKEKQEKLLPRMEDLAEEEKGWKWIISEEEVQTELEGKLWGGCMETLLGHFASGHHSSEASHKHMEKLVVFLESSECMIQPAFVYDLMAALSFRGIAQKCVAILVGIPKTEFLGTFAQPTPAAYREAQKKAILRGMMVWWKRQVPVVLDMHFGHCDPQLIVPYGKDAILDLKDKKILFDYSR